MRSRSRSGCAAQEPARPERVGCPWCGSGRVQRVGQFGPQLLTHSYLCLDCRSPFEVIRRL